MDPAMLFGFQVSVMLLVFALAARWYAAPVLAKRSFVDAMTVLLLVQATRVVGVTFVAPAVTDPLVPRLVSVPAAAGDSLTAVLALAALAALRRGWPASIALLWLVNVVGIVDLVYVTVAGVAIDFPSYRLGAAWFIPTVLGPAMIVTHALMIHLLRARRRGASNDRA